MKKIYISGKMTGLSKEEIDINFEKGRKEIEGAGHIAINPVDIEPYNMNNLVRDEYSEYVRGDCIELCKCDSIYMLNNWQDSNGAKIELRLAIDLNLEIIFQKENKL